MIRHLATVRNHKIPLPKNSPFIIHYVFSIFLLFLVFYLRMQARRILGEDAPLLPFLLAVILSAWVGSTNSGIFTVLFSSAIGVYFFIYPYNHFAINEIPDFIRLSLFVGEGILLSVIIGSLKATKKDLQSKSAELIDAKNEAENSNRSKSLFLANMSHEIRTPITAIQGFAQVLCENELSVDERESYLKIIRRSSNALSHLIDGILDLSKVESGKIEIEKVAFSPTSLIREAVTMFDIKAQEKGIRLDLKDGGLPTLITSDPTRLRQILINIIGNAVKFTSHGAVEVVASFSYTTKNEGLLKISVKDTGIGISPEEEKFLFKPFAQADSSMTRKFGGTGLGLSLSRQLARKLGGNLQLEKSTPGQGSLFTITALVGTPEVFCDNVNINDQILGQPDAPEKFQNLEGKKILVVEDSIENQMLLTCFLTPYGISVDIASEGREGVRKALTDSHDIILMDIQMPLMDGHEALKSLRQQGYTGPILALTAHSMIEEQTRCLESGFDGFLSKPISRETLLSAITNLTSKTNY